MKSRFQPRLSLRDRRELRSAACKQTGLFFGAIETSERDAEERITVNLRSVPVTYTITTNREALISTRC